MATDAAASAAGAAGVSTPAQSAPAMSASLAASASAVPRDAIALEQLLASMGLPPGSYQPRVIAQLLEFQQRQLQGVASKRARSQVHGWSDADLGPPCAAFFLCPGYQREILEDAQEYCKHRDVDGRAHIGQWTCGSHMHPQMQHPLYVSFSSAWCLLCSPCPDVDDIELAVQSRLGESFTSPPPKELMYSLAQARNSIPLPIVPTREGVHLPADRYCLLQPNYRVKAAPAQPQAHVSMSLS